MVPLNRYIKKTRHQDKEVLYNTVTNKVLPVDSDQNQLEEFFFLSGQEKSAIDSRLSSVTNQCSFTIIPTWECNLRCTHCVVLDKLVKKDVGNFNDAAIVSFIKRFKAHFNLHRINISFVGGEPLLALPRIERIIDNFEADYGMTTNLVGHIGDYELSVLSKFTKIGISLDGDHEEHNTQRKSADGIDPFVETIKNIKLLMKSGFQKKISVQAALRDEYVNNEHKERYYRNLLRLGVLPENIRFGCIHPTLQKEEPSNMFMAVLKKGKIISDMCCKYRSQTITIDKNELYTDYYSWDKIGTVFDEISTVLENQKRIIYNTMPVLKDEKCMKCPVIGSCWGGCTSGMQISENPSLYCNQEALIEEVRKHSEDGTLVKTLTAGKIHD